MKYILELILSTVIIFFIWNFLKRIFYSSFYKFPRSKNFDDKKTQNSNKNLDSKINWDAETVDYEEIKDKKE